jgi:hypothetical protein
MGSVEWFHRTIRGTRTVPAIRKLTPSYVLHKQSGRARAVWYDHNGVRQQKLLPGPFNSAESLSAFARFQLELAATPTSTITAAGCMTVAELLSAFLDYPTGGRPGQCALTPGRPGRGLNVYAIHGVRYFDAEATLALVGLIGGRDADAALKAVEHLRADTRGLCPHREQFTNRSEVIIGPTTRLILRHTRDIDWETDLDWPACRRMLGVIGRSRACLIGNLPAGFTHQAINFGRQVGTYMGLVAGERQFADLRGLLPDILFMGCPEAWAATGSDTTEPDTVFDRLVALSPASVVVMTNGADATHVADQASGERHRINPPRLGGRLFALGAGDVFAGAVTFLLGQTRGAISGKMLVEAVAFSHEVAASHITGDPALKGRVRVRCRDEGSRLVASGSDPSGASAGAGRRAA